VEGDEEWRLELTGSPGQGYRVQASLATLRRPFDVCGVTQDGRPLDGGWSYDAASQVLRARARAAGPSTVLVARSC
jgi:hypothetical protein